MADIGTAKAFSFRERPTPVPGDLRIRWRISLILLLLNSSRGKKASLAKLYVLSDAVQSAEALRSLDAILHGQRSELTWRVRVEPALARALDLMVGDKLADWTTVSDRIGVHLTTKGETAAKAVGEFEDALVEQKAALLSVGSAITETLVTRLISSKA